MRSSSHGVEQADDRHHRLGERQHDLKQNGGRAGAIDGGRLEQLRRQFLEERAHHDHIEGVDQHRKNQRPQQSIRPNCLTTR